MLIPNKWEILTCMILQFAEDWHKIIFKLGLKASTTSLVQIVIGDISISISFPTKLWICERYNYILSILFWTAAHIFNSDEISFLKLALELSASLGSASASEFIAMAKAKILKKRPFCLHSEPSFSYQVKYQKICSQKLISQKWKIIQDFCSDWCYLKNIGSHICWN